MRKLGGDRPLGGMAKRIEEFDWRSTALGSRDAWPDLQKGAVDTMLGCGFPAALWIGPTETMLYNDGYNRLLNGRNELGSDGIGVLRTAGEQLAPVLIQVRDGATVTFEDHPLPLSNDASGMDGVFTLSFSPVRDIAGAVSAVLLVLVETTRSAREVGSKSIVISELQHRVRNVLAVIRSIVSRTAATKETVEDLSAHLEGRLSALARTQLHLTRLPGSGVDLETLLRDELLAQVADEKRIEIDGPEFQLPPKAAEVMTLAVHELATNATKFGFFDSPSGHTQIRWSVEARNGGDWLAFEWRESGVQIVTTAPRRSGFGSVLLEQRIAYELGGAGSLNFAPGGVVCTIQFPILSVRSVLQGIDDAQPPREIN